MQSTTPIADVSFQGLIIVTRDFNSIVSTFVFNSTKQPVNSSFCNISNLEVYRGREQAVEINYNDGFSLNGNGSIKVDNCMN